MFPPLCFFIELWRAGGLLNRHTQTNGVRFFLQKTEQKLNYIIKVKFYLILVRPELIKSPGRQLFFNYIFTVDEPQSNTNITVSSISTTAAIVPLVTFNPLLAVVLTLVTVPTLSRPGLLSSAEILLAYPS